MSSFPCFGSETLPDIMSSFTLPERKKVPEHCAVQSNPPLRRKIEGKAGVKENVESGKEDYIHIRAKGGQATNNHSLAERVRREKISARMRLLQELVPGCNKVTTDTQCFRMDTPTVLEI